MLAIGYKEDVFTLRVDELGEVAISRCPWTILKESANLAREEEMILIEPVAALAIVKMAEDSID